MGLPAFKQSFKNYSRRKVKKAERKQHDWSILQRMVFDNIANGTGDTVIVASPGSGKSATILEGLWHVPPEFRGSESRTLSIAFNTTVAQHLNTYAPPGVDCLTFHRLGYQVLRREWGSVYGIGKWGTVDKDDQIAEVLAIQEVGDSYERARLRKNLMMAMKLAKNTLAVTNEEVDDVAANFGINTCGLSTDDFTAHVVSMMEKTRDKPLILNGQSVISFDDMIWLPYVNGWQPKKYDYVFVDEAQDMSPARFQLVKNSLTDNGRLFVFADPHQAIYSFAGAVPSLITNLEKESARLPLSISYRLPKSVVRLAKTINPEIQHADNAIEGKVYGLERSKIIGDITPGSAILSRANFPLVEAAFELLRQGVKANIIGKDIGNRFLWRLSCWEPDTIEDLEESVNEWRDEACEHLNEKRRSTQRIEDEAKSILGFADGADSINEVKERIESFFSDEKSNIIQLSTAHKAKGLEWDRVYLLDKTFKPEKGGEDERIYYVAITRPKKRLVFING